MYPINFEGANINLAKPNDLTDEQCSSLPAQKGIDDDGFPYFLTVWIPNKEDVEALKEGRPLFVKVLGESHPPIAIYTVDDKGEGNF